MSKYGVISGPYLVPIQENTEITPYLDTFHAIFTKYAVYNSTQIQNIGPNTEDEGNFLISKYVFSFLKKKNDNSRGLMISKEKT